LYNEDKNKEYELSWSCSTNGRIMYVYIHTWQYNHESWTVNKVTYWAERAVAHFLLRPKFLLHHRRRNMRCSWPVTQLASTATSMAKATAAWSLSHLVSGLRTPGALPTISLLLSWVVNRRMALQLSGSRLNMILWLIAVFLGVSGKCRDIYLT
jgi:hypothetical protein